MKNGDFTKRKFLNLSQKSQHKKCSELLRSAYEKQAKSHSCQKEIEAYRVLAGWMNYPLLVSTHHKTLADIYHLHANKGSVKHKEHHLLPAIRKGDRETAKPSWNLSIYLDHIRSAHNVGSILRTVEAFSMGNLYFSQDTPFSSKQITDTAMGAEKWVNCFTNIPLRDLPRPIFALETSDSALSLFNFSFPETFTLVVGNEEYGCSEQTLEIADAILEIPLRGHKNSLNVANAFAIVAAEISRQKTSQQ